MKQKVKKIILGIAAFSLIAIPVVGLVGLDNVKAAATGTLQLDDFWGGATTSENVTDSIGLSERDPREIIAAVVRVVLGFLGIITVLLILGGGFKYMTAGGDEDQIGEAKQLIISGVIGLVIVLASFGLASFLMTAAVNVTTNP